MVDRKLFGILIPIDISFLSALHVPSKQMILMITLEGNSHQIWKICLNTNRWKPLRKINLSTSEVSAALSSNEDYMLIVSGNKIFVLDIRIEDDYKLRECQIKAPFTRKCQILSMGGMKDELLVIGWTKRVYKDSKFTNLRLPAMYLMKLMTSYYNQEKIHFKFSSDFFNYGENHFAIKLRQILSSLL